MHALFRVTFLRDEIVSQQLELCIFRCVASAAHFLILSKIKFFVYLLICNFRIGAKVIKMSNKETEIINIISECLPKCCRGAAYYCYGDIPLNKFRNACDTYAGYVDYIDCIGLTDETIFGNGKRGFLFTLDGYYYNGCSCKSYYSSGKTFNSLSSLYNISAMNEMLQQLYYSSTRKTGIETFIDIAGTVLDILRDKDD